MEFARRMLGLCGIALWAVVTVRAQVNGNFAGSVILTESMKDQLRSWDVATIGGLPKKWIKCWSATITGANDADFHSLCNGKGRTFTVIKVDPPSSPGTVEGIFGGYTSLDWAGSCTYLTDNTAYIFNLVNPGRWFSDGSDSIFRCSSYGPTFGHHSICVESSSSQRWFTDATDSDQEGYPRPTDALHQYDDNGARRYFESSSGHIEVYYTDETPYYDNECNDGTENDPQVALPPPVLAAPNITSNNYILRFDVDKRYERVQVVFGEDSSNACNFDSFDETTTQNGWSVADSTVDTNCGETITFTKNAQTMIATSGTGSCDFTRSTVGDNVEFTKRVSIITNQTRTIEYQQGFRNSTYQELKYTHYVITITVPTTVTVNSAVQNVTGNITVLQAITNIKVDVDSEPYKVGFTMLASSQAPYQLTYSSFSATGDLGTSITRASDTPACADNNFNTPCVQSFVYSDLSIVTNCDTKSSLNDAVTITYDVGCKSTFTGNCITPSPSQISVSFTLISTQYCPQTQDVTISATLKTYKDISLDASSDWQVADESTNFVVGSTVYGQVEVTVGENAATTATTKIRTLTTHTTYNSVPTVVYSGGSGVTGVTVEQGDTANGGSANWPSDNKQARFSMLLANPTTVALDPVLDVAQAVIITAVVDVTYTTASAPKSPLLQNWHEQNHGQVRLQSAQSALGTASSTVGVGSAGGQSAGSPSASSTSIAGMSATTVVAVACALVLLVVAAAYAAGKRNGPSSAELQAQKESVLSLSQLRSSSAVDVTADVEDATDSNSTSLSTGAEDTV